MAISIMLQPRKPLWDILKDPQSGRPVLRIGDHTLPVADILEVEHTDLEERDFKGLLVMGSIFMLACTIFMLLVIDFGWRERFMLGAIVTGILGMASLYEAATSTKIGFVELRIITRTGDEHFTIADRDDAAALEFALTRQRV